MKAYLNDKEIPLEDCVDNDGNLAMPEYMKEGDIIKFTTNLLSSRNKTQYNYLTEISELIH